MVGGWEKDEVSGLGTLQEDILPQAINLITRSPPNSTLNSLLQTVVQSIRLGMIMVWSVVEDVLGCPAVMSSHGCRTKTTGNLTAD